ncbi:MAG: methyltransferase domain-containing protein [Chloroflexi bacterium]|nr:methyltransferase domain-containing protein [Ktedonobacteraceae bacterium]MBV8823344.1 methyltransferase domain-containing protein [Ktedonobacteraceae bacterium]MBV9021543.1 methyltransferase domain-containing protein [Ktedonobacteraceae bacterium]MBV9706424.1 methyltransferase domain-containing protein [Chloroflexota bacterium]
MGLIETDETNQFTFEQFAAHASYVEVNRVLVQQALVHLAAKPQLAPLTIVDMACGTGAVTRLIIEELARKGWLAQTHVVGVDPSAEALRRAKKGIQAMGLDVRVDFVQGEASDLSCVVENVDMAFFCNAIHLVADKLAAFREMAAILTSGSIFACNSAFYQGTYVEGTDRFYRLWVRRAVGWLRKEHPEVQLSRTAKATARQWLTPEQYDHTLQQAGFDRVHMVQTDVPLSLDAWNDLGHYWLFIEGALPGVPLALGASALETAVYQAGQELSLNAVPRTWLQLIATKA